MTVNTQGHVCSETYARMVARSSVSAAGTAFQDDAMITVTGTTPGDVPTWSILLMCVTIATNGEHALTTSTCI